MDNQNDQNSGVFGSGVQSNGGMGDVIPTTSVLGGNIVNDGMQSNLNGVVVPENENMINNIGEMSGNIGTTENNVSNVNDGLSFDLPSINNNVSLGSNDGTIGMGNVTNINNNNNLGGNVSTNNMDNNANMNVNTNNMSSNSENINYNMGSANGVNNNTQTNYATESRNNINVAPVVSVKKFLGYMILFSIPVVGFIVLIVKALDKNDKNISNYAKAQLLMGIILFVLMVVLFLITVATISKLIPSYARYIDQSWDSTIDTEGQENLDTNLYDSSDIKYSIG